VSSSALALVLAAALGHATWNLLAKRAGGGVQFVWLHGALSTLLYAPVGIAMLALRWHDLGAPQLLFISGSALLHTAYFLLLQRGYRDADLSLVYPLARGTGPTLATAAAIAWLGERPTPLAMAGGALVVTSVFFFARPGAASSAARRRGGVAYGLATGILIASYTLWDKHAVAALAISPLVLDWTTSLLRTSLLAPLALRHREQLRREWQAKKTAVLWIAVLCPLSYILVLVAMRTSPVSYVAPIREVSILFGALLGALFLREGEPARRLAAAAVMVLGVAALALG
jgi:drug/metabolite transporter (DMT)-like permease